LIKSKSKNKICAVIPFYNEENTVNDVITKTREYVETIIAVNDGSTDNSGNSITEDKNVIVVDLEKNCGKGIALNNGFNKAIELEYDIIITLDADLQHDPADIPSILNEIDKYHIVIGNRMNNLSGMPLQRRLSNKITSFLLSIKTGQRILDSQCGFRAIRSEVLTITKPKSNGFEAESELIILAARNGFKIGFADISTIYGTEISKIKPAETILAFIKTMFI
jgi:glycosyltransferase involved in cell wall biosynthesis